MGGAGGVALRKESVDRNPMVILYAFIGVLSLSARRAWIEINMLCSVGKFWVVALRKESVDRNCSFGLSCADSVSSLSARRAWIEIFLSMGLDGRFKSLSARRAWIEIDIPPNLDADRARRSPQGERG